MAHTTINTIASAGFTNGLLLEALAHNNSKRRLALDERHEQSGDKRREKVVKIEHAVCHVTLPWKTRVDHSRSQPGASSRVPLSLMPNGIQ